VGLLKKRDKKEMMKTTYLKHNGRNDIERERAEKHGRRMKKKMSELNNFLRRTDGSSKNRNGIMWSTLPQCTINKSLNQKIRTIGSLYILRWQKKLTKSKPFCDAIIK
jgi:hypothetical protein